jgi:predicted CoA-binding protein
LTTLVLGASENPERYSHLAIVQLRKENHAVYAVGRRSGQVLDVPIQTTLAPDWKIDTVTLYLNPQQQREYYEAILSLRPRRVIFNPGTENEDFAGRVRAAGMVAQEACTLVLLRTGQYSLY